MGMGVNGTQSRMMDRDGRMEIIQGRWIGVGDSGLRMGEQHKVKPLKSANTQYLHLNKNMIISYVTMKYWWKDMIF